MLTGRDCTTDHSTSPTTNESATKADFAGDETRLFIAHANRLRATVRHIVNTSDTNLDDAWVGARVPAGSDAASCASGVGSGAAWARLARVPRPGRRDGTAGLIAPKGTPVSRVCTLRGK